METTRKELIDAIFGLWWQFGYPCGAPIYKTTDKGGFSFYLFRHSGGMSDLEAAEAILLAEGRIEKYRKNGRMEWYKPVSR